MTSPVLSLRELNRATLARQMLLEREAVSPYDAVRRLAGLQAQVPNPPYIGLWTRLRGFERDELTDLILERRVVRSSMMRATLHLTAAEDYLLLRPAIQAALDRSLRSIAGKRLEGLDLERLVSEARAMVEVEPRTFKEIQERLLEMEPDRDPSALAYLVRMRLPLVQTPPAGTWGTGGSPRFALPEPWLGSALADPDESLRALALRYLAAFGPAGVKDFQAWSGLTGAKSLLEEMSSGLRIFRDEGGNELFDLPDAPLPPADTPAPPRFVPEYDNLVLSHADRRRAIADENRKKVFLSAARVRATFLLDGFVAGVWKIEKTKKAAALTIEPFGPLSTEDRDALASEGGRLLSFATDGQPELDVRFENAG
ncbi:MAG: winged helix DNA-binding domain-containing protein [Rubrobacter sp.]